MPWWATLLVGAIGALAGGAGVTAWVKVFAERKKLNIETAGEAVTISSTVLKDVYQSYANLNDELVQVRMEGSALQQEKDDMRKELQECRVAAILNQETLKEQRRLTLLARRHAHLARHALGNYELHIDTLLDELRKHDIPITPMMRTQKLREAFQAEEEKLEAMESSMVKEDPL